MPGSAPSDVDLLLLHAPSVYDFRKKAILYGPVSDMVPSSTVFEMYPLGFLTMASYLHDRGMRVRIVNLALRMMNSRRFDVPQFLARQRPAAVGIDLHWLPHAHGALEVARIVKELHPELPVILGGLSSSYYHRELIGYPQVDYVLRGDSTEPPLHQLLLALKHGTSLADIPNLTWKDAAGSHVNPLSFLPLTAPRHLSVFVSPSHSPRARYPSRRRPRAHQSRTTGLPSRPAQSLPPAN